MSKATLISAGTLAPDFSAPDDQGNMRSLSELRGKKVVLYFYPEDDTPGCTKQACDLRDNYALLQTAGYVVWGISPNPVESHQRFIQKYTLPFTLIADPELTIAQLYGVYGEKNLYGRKFMGIHRVTYLLDENGVITHVFSRAKTTGHAEQILKHINK